MSSKRYEIGLLDTSVVIDLHLLRPEHLPRESWIAAVTMAELVAGPIAAHTDKERWARQHRATRAMLDFHVVPFDDECALEYGRIYARVAEIGRKPHGARLADLLIAAVAARHSAPLYTRNPADFEGLEDIVTVVGV